MFWFVIPLLFGGVISLDRVGFNLSNSDALHDLYEGAVGDVKHFLDSTAEPNIKAGHHLTDANARAILKELGAEAKASTQLQAVTDGLLADSEWRRKYNHIEQHLKSPETITRILGGARSFKDLENNQEMLQINMEKELGLLDGPLRSFMQSVAEHTDQLAFSAAMSSHYHAFSPGFSWLYSSTPDGLFIDLQTVMEEKAWYGTKGTPNKLEKTTFEQLSNRFQIGWSNDTHKVWFTLKTDLTSRRAGLGYFYTNGVDCLEKPCGTPFEPMVRPVIDVFRPIIDHFKNRNTLNTGALPALEVPTVPTAAAAPDAQAAPAEPEEPAELAAPAVNLMINGGEEVVRRKLRHQKHQTRKPQVAGRKERFRMKKRNLATTKNSMTASSASQTVEGVQRGNIVDELENFEFRTSDWKSRCRFFIQFRANLRRDQKARTDRGWFTEAGINFEYGWNFYDDFSKFTHHLEARVVMDLRKNLEVSPSGTFIIGNDGKWKGGGGVESTYALTNSIPPDTRPVVIGTLRKIFYSILGGQNKGFGKDRAP